MRAPTSNQTAALAGSDLPGIAGAAVDFAPNAPAPWSRYQDNLARHLIGLARDLQNRLMSHLVSERGHRGLRPSFGVLVEQVARSPRPISALARTLGISAQAASQLVGLAERAGYLARRPDPRDARARQIVLSPSGLRLVRDGVARLRALEAEHERRVGEADYRRFLVALGKLVSDVESSSPSARATVGRLPMLAAQVEQRLMHAMSRRGHGGLKLSHSQILTLIGPAGTRLHRLAELHRVSRQAISAVAQDLAALGYVTREADAEDRRGVVVRWTERGRELIADSVGEADVLERDWRAQVGDADFEALVRVARRLYASLDLETGILTDAFAVERSRADRGDAADGADPSCDEIVRLAAHLRNRLGARDAARLAAHLAAHTPMPTGQ